MLNPASGQPDLDQVVAGRGLCDSAAFSPLLPLANLKPGRAISLLQPSLFGHIARSAMGDFAPHCKYLTIVGKTRQPDG